MERKTGSHKQEMNQMRVCRHVVSMLKSICTIIKPDNTAKLVKKLKLLLLIPIVSGLC